MVEVIGKMWHFRICRFRIAVYWCLLIIIIVIVIPAYLASAASTLSLQADIPCGCACIDDSYLQSYLSSWSSSFGATPDTLPARQPFWDRPGIQAAVMLVMNLPFCRGINVWLSGRFPLDPSRLDCSSTAEMLTLLLLLLLHTADASCAACLYSLVYYYNFCCCCCCTQLHACTVLVYCTLHRVLHACTHWFTTTTFVVVTHS